MIISFSGAEGSGKSGVAKRLAEELGWPYYDIGGLRRQHASERGLTLEEYNKLGETDSRTDTEVDEYQKKLGEEQDNFVIVGRTSFHFIPHSIKIFLETRLEVGAERIFNDLTDRNEGHNLHSLEAVKESLQRRLQSDTYRYQKYFGIDVYNPAHFDWRLDTSDLTKEEVYQRVRDYVQRQLKADR